MAPDADRSERRILVTGAGGFVGRHLIAFLLQPDPVGSCQDTGSIRIMAAVSPNSALPLELRHPSAPTFATYGWNGSSIEGRIEVATLDVRDAQRTREVLQRFKPHEVYHLAARASGADADREAIYAVNVAGSRNVLEAAASVYPFPRVLIVSSCYVYGETARDRPAREEDPIGPLWRYGAYTDSKMEMENAARGYRGLAIIARSSAHTGPGQQPGFAIPAFARQLARMEAGLEPAVVRVGNLESRRDLLDARDVVRAYSLLMAQGDVGSAYNVASGRPYAIGEILERLRGLCQTPTWVTPDPGLMRSGDISCSSGDASVLSRLTGWSPRYEIDVTLRSTLDYWRDMVARGM